MWKVYRQTTDGQTGPMDNKRRSEKLEISDQVGSISKYSDSCTCNKHTFLSCLLKYFKINIWYWPCLVHHILQFPFESSLVLLQEPDLCLPIRIYPSHNMSKWHLCTFFCKLFIRIFNQFLSCCNPFELYSQPILCTLF